MTKETSPADRKAKTMTTLTTPADLEITATTAQGNEYTVAVYVDPFPGRKGTDRVSEDCGKCSGTGVIGYGNVTLQIGNRSDRFCFDCAGSGLYSRLVSSARTTARRVAAAENIRRADAADWAAGAPAREAAEKAEAETAAYAEAARLEAKPKGHIGNEGDRLKGMTARVEMIRYYESQNYVTGAPESKCIIKFSVDGKTAVWFTGWAKELEEGQTVSLSGTVKDHNTRDGEDQTILTRCVAKAV